ncbi:small T antigen [African elephant polyomavirus 1]|uniref:Small T antigen n=1 Tax=African elephant polyomavirus 1 TaxID=1399914 RepID=T2FF38_9POLY|nr:small T antigen [African elephant polyomavirus 1]AGV77096.1 small T antigen [African elephant polyomavirus 1]
MDRALNREDSKSLMGLLGLNMEQYGNVPLMYNRYKKKCLQYHPEKGGNATIMKELNRLWTQFTCSLEKVRRQDEEGQSWSRSEVSARPHPDNLFGRFPDCFLGRSPKCSCYLCILALSHSIRKGTVRGPNVWMKCCCFTCFCIWFGLHPDYNACKAWAEVIKRTPIKHLNI